MYVVRLFVYGVWVAHLFMADGYDQPDHEKWGELAAKQILEEYPDYKLVTYSYEGEHAISTMRNQYTYTMAVKKGGEEKIVNVYVLMNPQTEKPVDVYFDEMEREAAYGDSFH
ncbi:DUF3889 domain-containing protein [Bacillus piscicola]|uniref:DUF3889 domain-containing protein n=1 Tax=Bacillus piscicola TaxID=1632684 RepID=UPI001F088FF2|nr:DUF3889 domain-containing protein [Bacillus piscicola]